MYECLFPPILSAFALCFLGDSLLTGSREDLIVAWFSFSYWLKMRSIVFMYLVPICTTFENTFIEFVCTFIDLIIC